MSLQIVTKARGIEMYRSGYQTKVSECKPIAKVMVKNWPGHWTGMWLMWFCVTDTLGFTKGVSGQLYLCAYIHSHMHIFLILFSLQALKSKYANVYDDMSSHQIHYKIVGEEICESFHFIPKPLSKESLYMSCHEK